MKIMPFDPQYHEAEPTPEELEQASGLLVVEFGAGWCGHCAALSPTLEVFFNANPAVRHLRIADGRGKRLGRSFRVKLWPTLVLLRDGTPVDQLVRPEGDEAKLRLERFVAESA